MRCPQSILTRRTRMSRETAATSPSSNLRRLDRRKHRRTPDPNSSVSVQNFVFRGDYQCCVGDFGTKTSEQCHNFALKISKVRSGLESRNPGCDGKPFLLEKGRIRELDPKSETTHFFCGAFTLQISNVVEEPHPLAQPNFHLCRLLLQESRSNTAGRRG